MEPHDLDDVVERAERGRVFYEVFPGTAAGEAWVRQREAFERQDGSDRPTEGRGADTDARRAPQR